MMARMVVAGVLACVAQMSLAAGDMPVKLDRAQAAAEYARIRPLLDNEGRTCPVGQVPVSGLMTGGAAPGTGSRTTTIAFDKGATVRIVRTWTGQDAASGSASFTVSCASSATTVSVNTAELIGDVGSQDAAERCREVEASLRLPASGKCPPNVAPARPAPAGLTSDSDYLQHRAATLNSRIDLAVTEHKLTRRQAAELSMTVGQMQALAGNLQTRRGMIARADADRINQRLTDVERELPVTVMP